VSVKTALRHRLAQYAPGIDDRLARARWRVRNRDRSYSPNGLAPSLRGVLDELRRSGVAITDAGALFDDPALYDEAAARARELYESRPVRQASEEGTKESFKAKLAEKTFDADHPFVRVALHPNVLAVANGYLRLRSTLRALELWLTEPTPGPAIQTQLWHRDADDVMNVKLFMYFNDVPIGAGPFTYAPGTHPLGSRRSLPEHDESGRTTDEQMAAVVPSEEWLVCEGSPGTVIFTDTCGYHKQLKPESAERLMLVAHYVSGVPLVPPVIDIRGADRLALDDNQYVAVFDRERS
jgi:Phytanoyl-CoA dioxygenase (PhyH)